MPTTPQRIACNDARAALELLITSSAKPPKAILPIFKNVQNKNQRETGLVSKILVSDQVTSAATHIIKFFSTFMQATVDKSVANNLCYNKSIGLRLDVHHAITYCKKNFSA